MKKQRHAAPAQLELELPEEEYVPAPDLDAEADAEIEALQKQVDDADADRKARLEARGKVQKLGQLKRDLVEGPALEAAEREYGEDRVRLVQTPVGGVIVKVPARAKFKHFSDKERLRTDDFIELIQPCRVYPSAEKFADILDNWPATVAQIANVVLSLAGVRTEKESVK